MLFYAYVFLCAAGIVRLSGLSPHPVLPVKSSIIVYGQYCGPGPDERLWSILTPVDDLDQACYDHDKAYNTCLGYLSQDIGLDAPSFLNQIMPVRGLFPSIITRALLGTVPRYASCMHQADSALVTAFEQKLAPLSGWWLPSVSEAVGAGGVSDPCALGLPGYCLLPSKAILSVALEVFRSSVLSDLI